MPRDVAEAWVLDPHNTIHGRPLVRRVIARAGATERITLRDDGWLELTDYGHHPYALMVPPTAILGVYAKVDV